MLMMSPWLTQPHRKRRSILSKLIETFDNDYIHFAERLLANMRNAWLGARKTSTAHNEA